MTVELTTRMDDVVVVTIDGELDATSVELVEPLLRDARKVAGRSTVFDLRGLRLVDSQGVRTMYSLFQRVGEASSVDVLMPVGQPRMVLDRLGLSQRLVTSKQPNVPGI